MKITIAALLLIITTQVMADTECTTRPDGNGGSTTECVESGIHSLPVDKF